MRGVWIKNIPQKNCTRSAKTRIAKRFFRRNIFYRQYVDERRIVALSRDDVTISGIFACSGFRKCCHTWRRFYAGDSVKVLRKVLGNRNVFYKNESLNSTCSFKARGLSAAISKAKELGVRETVIPTAGNAGGALAAYSAQPGIKAHVSMPEQTPNAFKTEVLLFGAEIQEVNGSISDCGKLLNAEAAKHMVGSMFPH
jgi:tryptophan synthase beta subunit